jgi:hypothetical protein
MDSKNNFNTKENIKVENDIILEANINLENDICNLNTDIIKIINNIKDQEIDLNNEITYRSLLPPPFIRQYGFCLN